MDKEQFPEDLSDIAPDLEHNLFYQSGKHREPIFDVLRAGENPGIRPTWPEEADFAVCLTHDVDFIGRYHPAIAYRKGLSNLKTFIQSGQFKYFRHTVKAGFEFIGSGLIKDPLQRLDAWLDLETSLGVKSTFFVTPESTGKHHWTDCTYKYSDRIRHRGSKVRFAEILREMDSSGWDIGLHPSWWTYTDPELMLFQKDQLEGIINHPVESVRQHFLHYAPNRTAEIQRLAGLKYDSTLGFNNDIGFKHGTCWPWRLPVQNGEQLLEIPLIVQDVAMFHPGKQLKYSREEAVSKVLELADSVRKVGGVLTLSWHPDSVENELVFSTYAELVKRLQGMRPWFGTVKDVGSWWARENHTLRGKTAGGDLPV